MKKTHFSPVMPLLVSFSLVLGILVSDLAGCRFLNAAHAQNSSHPSWGNSLKISEGVAPDGVMVQGLIVNGQVVTHGVIAGSVRIVDSTVVNTSEDFGVSTSGVVVGDTVSTTNPSTTVSLSGVVVGDTLAITSGVVVGDTNSILLSDEVVLSSITILNGNASGGMLTGDGITVSEDGVITGENLVLNGTTVHISETY